MHLRYLQEEGAVEVASRDWQGEVEGYSHREAAEVAVVEDLVEVPASLIP